MNKTAITLETFLAHLKQRLKSDEIQRLHSVAPQYGEPVHYEQAYSILFDKAAKSAIFFLPREQEFRQTDGAIGIFLSAYITGYLDSAASAIVEMGDAIDSISILNKSRGQDA